MRRALAWAFRSRVDGRIVVAQWPNPSLWLYIAASVVGTLVETDTRPATVARVVARIALVWWAADELARGVNPWRRALGLTVLALQVLALVR